MVFIHIPQKDEIKFNRVNPFGLLARESIEKNGGNLIDGFSRCGLQSNDYYPNDGHPNQEGYSKIEQCVTRIIKDAWPHI